MHDISSKPHPSCKLCNNHMIFYRRLVGLLQATEGTVEFGGETDEASRFISPTLVSDVKPDDKLMQVCGPIPKSSHSHILKPSHSPI